MTLQQLELILAIVDSGSVHGASQALNKTQPTLTKALRLLEEELGVSIFTRSSRGMTPTEFGNTVIARARVICLGANKLREEVAQQLGAANGKVSACVSPLVAFAMLPSILADFRKKWPEVEVNIAEDLFPNALGRLRDGQADICVGPHSSGASREFEEETLFSTRLVAVARQNAKFNNDPSWDDLAKVPWVLMSSPNGYGQQYAEEFFQLGYIPPKQITRINSLSTLLEVMRHSDCCSLFPEQLFALLPDSSDLKIVATFDNSPPVDVCLFTKHDTPLPPAAEALVRVIRLFGNNFLRDIL